MSGRSNGLVAKLHRVSRAAQRRYCKAKATSQLRRLLEGRRLWASYPFLRDWEGKNQRARLALKDKHEVYCREVSTKSMAISLETASFLKVYCEGARPKDILDLGSGFSSFVFRSFAASHTDTVVWSVDDSQEWLRRTKAYLAIEGLPTNNLVLWTEADEPLQVCGTVDLIFHDLGRDLRSDALGLVMSQAQQGAVAILDDMHRSDYARLVRAMARHYRCDYISLMPYTYDHFGRFCGLVVSRRSWSGF